MKVHYRTWGHGARVSTACVEMVPRDRATRDTGEVTCLRCRNTHLYRALTPDGGKVYQASPSTCVKVARDYLNEANRLLLAGEAEAAGEQIRHALGWLPSWLEREWDGRMAAWMAREGVPAE